MTGTVLYFGCPSAGEQIAADPAAETRRPLAAHNFGWYRWGYVTALMLTSPPAARPGPRLPGIARRGDLGPQPVRSQSAVDCDGGSWLRQAMGL